MVVTNKGRAVKLFLLLIMKQLITQRIVAITNPSELAN